MFLKRLIQLSLLISFFIIGCSKKHHPAKSPENVTMIDSAAMKKVARPKKRVPVAKVIIVNDNVAHKSLDGRLYYDLLGHRYWKNYKDGKYYLFNQAMYSNDDFKPK